MAKSKRISGWTWKQDRNDAASWEAKDGPITLQVWEGGEGIDAWLWSVDIGGTGACAPSETLSLYGPPARRAEQAMARAEMRALKFVESLTRRFSVRTGVRKTRAAPKPRKAVKK